MTWLMWAATSTRKNACISIATLNGLVNGTYRLFNYAGAKLKLLQSHLPEPGAPGHLYD